jgi:hypothetical protein
MDNSLLAVRDINHKYIVVGRLVNVMGGTVLETESERLIRIGRTEGENKGRTEGRAAGIIETLYEVGFSDIDIVEKLQTKLHISLQQAQEYLQMYGKQKA